MGRWQSTYHDFVENSGSAAVTPDNVNDYVTMTARAAYRVTDNVTVSLTAQQFNAPLLMQTAGPMVTRSLIGGVTAHF
jgi:outer membrane receptor for ferrienterochelin and colicins